MSQIENMLEAAAGGERVALARLLSLVERCDDNLLAIEDAIRNRSGNAFVIGITGPPGAGKSTLISALLPHAIAARGCAAVLAVDPSSPFSGGALLGDRVRMQGRNYGSKAFVRSMASRGDVGGLARATSTCVRIFDACGWPVVVIETLGIGQAELDIMDLADAVVVVLNPEWGDTFQANKAGLTEAGDIFVINKSDKPGVAQTRKDLQESLSLLTTSRKPAIVETVAANDEGLAELWQAIGKFEQQLSVDGSLFERRKQRQKTLIRKILHRQLDQKVDAVICSQVTDKLIAAVSSEGLNFDEAVNQLVKELPLA